MVEMGTLDPKQKVSSCGYYYKILSENNVPMFHHLFAPFRACYLNAQNILSIIQNICTNNN